MDKENAEILREIVEQALCDAGIGVKPEYVVRGDFDWHSGAEAAKKLLRLPKIPTAICGVNDPCAMGAIRGCREAGLQVPRDISITGFGAIEFEYAPEPFLTTTETSRLELGRAAATMLLEIIEGRKPYPLEQLIEPRLVVRRSTAPLRKGTGPK